MNTGLVLLLLLRVSLFTPPAIEHGQEVGSAHFNSASKTVPYRFTASFLCLSCTSAQHNLTAFLYVYTCVSMCCANNSSEAQHTQIHNDSAHAASQFFSSHISICLNVKPVISSVLNSNHCMKRLRQLRLKPF